MFGSENGVDSLTSLYVRANTWYDYGHTLSAKKNKKHFINQILQNETLPLSENLPCTSFFL